LRVSPNIVGIPKEFENALMKWDAIKTSKRWPIRIVKRFHGKSKKMTKPHAAKSYRTDLLAIPLFCN
jgi:hypothetical protein